eukprot:6441415-Prymnesium_polylepis.2
MGPPSPSAAEDADVAAVAGGAIGGVLGVGLLAGAAYVLTMRQRARSKVGSAYRVEIVTGPGTVTEEGGSALRPPKSESASGEQTPPQGAPPRGASSLEVQVLQPQDAPQRPDQPPSPVPSHGAAWPHQDC